MLELLIVIAIIGIMLVALIPAVNSLTKSGGRKAAISSLLGVLEQARTHAIKTGRPTYVVFPDTLPAAADTATVQRYSHRSYAIYEEDPGNPAAPKQVTKWETLPTGISIRSGSLNYLAKSISFTFTPAGGSAPFAHLKFTAQGEVDPSSTPSNTAGTIQFGIFEGSVENGTDRDTSSSRFTESIAVARLTGRAVRMQ